MGRFKLGKCLHFQVITYPPQGRGGLTAGTKGFHFYLLLTKKTLKKDNICFSTCHGYTFLS